LPESTDHYSVKWDGECHITVEVFRDLGLAFAAVLVLTVPVLYYMSQRRDRGVLSPVDENLVSAAH
jgi:hypothetical protein